MDTGVVKTVLLPCYWPVDFAPAGGKPVGSSGYDRWRVAARRELTRYLAAGYAVELVSVRPHEFQAWLAANDIEDDLQARLDYVRAARQAPRRTVRLGTMDVMSRRTRAS